MAKSKYITDKSTRTICGTLDIDCGGIKIYGEDKPEANLSDLLIKFNGDFVKIAVSLDTEET